ncbi:hypothetical protein LJB90_01880 [Eubacteriales bacterium OttesenSCG-928-G02]|nr:hypothetical protein [Eubacteriales bacterium OttesenSCG-928-G02]
MKRLREMSKKLIALAIVLIKLIFGNAIDWVIDKMAITDNAFYNLLLAGLIVGIAYKLSFFLTGKNDNPAEGSFIHWTIRFFIIVAIYTVLNIIKVIISIP